MTYMKATKKNDETVKKIIFILNQEGCSVEEAYSILDYVKVRIKYTSNVGLDTEPNFVEED